ncbi:hypothetical protein E1295_32425 [Nonomuraea mesophila]|uniref:Uncharacterized protein n=1 Tax=Nonomuraea mesophila TaxID=2530382 RepID=A0A4R5EXY9_9ACTN|nr:hypothetical protein [Nonomuraea mesophila]TDE39915.1 hypothetical protein E1295_32425 [Nonomuraea mesophila]
MTARPLTGPRSPAPAQTRHRITRRRRQVGPPPKFLIVPIDVQVRPAVNTLLIRGDASLSALARLVPSATVASQETTLAAIRDDPLTSAVRWALVVVTVALASYAPAAIVLGLMVGAAERARAARRARSRRGPVAVRR